MCGEHDPPCWSLHVFQGSSPHVRGARLERDENPSGSGIIPACAGSTDRVGAAGSLVGDHPRMCGEHITPNPFANAVLGSSPHVRGALLQRQRHRIRAGIIPACAGSTWSMAIGTAWDGDHPRMCGEHRISVNTVSSSAGSSPHVRGAHNIVGHLIHITGIIPACAGSTARDTSKIAVFRDHPRMCGEHFRYD